MVRIIHINSADRVANSWSSDGNFEYVLNQPITSETQVVLLRASIPKTYYLINTGNYLTLIEGSQSVNVSMPAGNYNVRSFQLTLQKLLTQLSPNHYTYTMTGLSTFSSTVDTGKFTISVGAIPNGATQPQIVVYDTLYEQLGFNKNTTNTFVENALTAPNVYNMNKENTVFIHSDICDNAGDNILQEIYTVSNLSNSYIAFENYMPKHYMKKIAMPGNKYHFWLTDEFGRTLDLNGINMNLTLCLT